MSTARPVVLFALLSCGGSSTPPDPPPTDPPPTDTDGIDTRSTGDTGALPPTGDGLPVGIPEPSFGWGLDLGVTATVVVDDTDPACDDAGPGTAAAPWCDLFRGGRTATFAAGDAVELRGGPYTVAGDYTLALNGTASAPVLVVGAVRFDAEGGRADFAYEGSYGVVAGIDFFHGTRHRIAGDHLVLRDVQVHNPPGATIDFNPVVSVTGHDVLIHDSAIYDNRRSSDTDSHGIQASEGSHHVWILDSELYNNNGDAFQGCHHCFGAPPHHIYIGRNTLHEDRENAVDLKTIHDVVVSENTMYGYRASATSSGDAMVIGSNGFDDATNMGPRRVWVLHNDIRDSTTGIRVEGSEDVWLVGNLMTDVGVGVQIDDKVHRDITVAANTLVGVTSGDGISVYGCAPVALRVVNNIIADVSERHLDLGGCGAPALSLEHNLLYAAAGVAVRVDGGTHSDVVGLNGEAFATGNVSGDPVLTGGVPAAGSPAVDAGTSLEAVYSAFEAGIGPSIRWDRAGTARPVGVEDIGAYERM